VLLRLTTDSHEALRGLFETAELLVKETCADAIFWYWFDVMFFLYVCICVIVYVSSYLKYQNLPQCRLNDLDRIFGSVRPI